MADRRRARGRNTGTGRTLSEWWPYWENELGARDCRPATVTTYEKGFKKLTRFLGDIPAESLTPDQVEQWRDHMANVQQHKPNTINGHLRWIGSFYNWLVAEGVIAESPIAQVDYVRCKDGFASPPVFDAPQVQQLIAGARRGQRSGRGAYEVLRNEAIMLLLADTGIRASECAGLLLENVNLAALVHAEITKGRYARVVTFGFQTARVLSRYLRAREKHAFAFRPEMFLGRRGPMAYWGIYELVKTAGRDAGIIGARPHLLRHTWAHNMKMAGADLEVLMSLGGWTSPQMVMRYGRAEKSQRAVDAYQRLGSPVDRAGMDKRRAKPTAAQKRKPA